MKFKLLFLTLAAALSLSLPTFAQKAEKVYLIYFYPDDQPINDNEKMTIATQLNTLIVDVQNFYRDEMMKFGYRDKTFDFEPIKFFAISSFGNGKVWVN